jgi:aspartokinase/homoserine dehydrogenase 1
MPRRSSPSPRPVVYKFGGAALADAPAIRRVLAVIAASRGPTVVVVSALEHVTDDLHAAAARAVRGDATGARGALTALAERHLAVARALLAPAARRPIVATIRTSFAEAGELVQGLALLRELTPRSSDWFVARGERLSAQIVAAALGRRGRCVDATTIIHTDGRFGDAFPDLRATDRSVRRALGPLLRRGIVPVVPGFIGAAPGGEIVTLGRGGTDLSAVTIGRSLHAREISLWKDVPGLLTADPRVVPDARVVPQMHVREAAELAYYGAKVLHPRALIPLEGRRIPIRIRPFADPSSPGTEVTWRHRSGRSPVRALAAIPAQAIVTVEGNGMLGVPGIAARTFAAMHDAGISVSLISQASSEHSICFTVPAPRVAAANQALRAAFRDELRRGEIDDVTVQDGLATLAVVGIGMAGARGVAARTFGALRDAGINIVAIAQGSSELNISMVVDETRVRDAQRAIHRAFQLDKIGGGAVGEPARTDVVILGFGQIGQLVASLAARPRRDGLALRVVAVLDRSGLVFDARGLGPRRLVALTRAKQAARPLATVRGARPLHGVAAIAFTASHALQCPIVLDLTAADSTPALLAALRGGMDVVLANKRPMSGPVDRAAELRETAGALGRHLLAEATVGAGLPILDTYSKLEESGDRVRRIDGCLSGTLGFLFDGLGQGRAFSDVVRDAMAHGYTEPDPRDDLSGLDVGRKALILARLMGYGGELSDIAIESLVPTRARGWPLARFLSSLESFDAEWKRRVEAAAAQGRVLRYVATATRRSVRVGLAAVDAASPFRSLSGTDNQVVFATDRYRERPLVVTGPGAGPAVTAAGVMNDILSLARRAR